MYLVINLRGDSGSKTQVVAPRSAFKTTILVTLLETLLSWRKLCATRCCSAILRIVWACSYEDCLLGIVSAKVSVLCLLWQTLVVGVNTNKCY